MNPKLRRSLIVGLEYAPTLMLGWLRSRPDTKPLERVAAEGKSLSRRQKKELAHARLTQALQVPRSVSSRAGTVRGLMVAGVALAVWQVWEQALTRRAWHRHEDEHQQSPGDVPREE